DLVTGVQTCALPIFRLNLETEDASISTAFSWCERAKSRGLVELLAHHLPSVQARTEDSLHRRIDRLREELNVQYMRSRPETRSRSEERRVGKEGWSA